MPHLIVAETVGALLLQYPLPPSSVRGLLSGHLLTQEVVIQPIQRRMWLCDWILANGEWVEVKYVTSRSFPSRERPVSSTSPFPSLRLEGKCSAELPQLCRQWQLLSDGRATTGKEFGSSLPPNLCTSLGTPTSTVEKNIYLIIVSWGLVLEGSSLKLTHNLLFGGKEM